MQYWEPLMIVHNAVYGETGGGGVGEGGGGGRGGEGGGRGSEGGGGGSKHSLSNKQNEPLLTGVLMQQQYSAPGEPGALITELIWVPDPSRLQPNRCVTPDPTLQDTPLGPDTDPQTNLK